MPKPPAPAPAKAAPATGGAYSAAFDQNDLPKEWKLVNPDENRWTMQPKRKSVMLITQKGSCPNLKDGKNQLVLERSLPSDDFELIVRVTSHFEVPGSMLAANLVRDEDNYFSLQLYSDNYLGQTRHAVYFAKRFQGQDTGHYRADVEGARDAYLKIVREGSEYSGSYALIDSATPATPDKLKWVSLGTLPWIHLQPKLVLCGANYADAPEVSAEFFSVTVGPK
jgi:hypothetical protein